ncbi:MAG: Ger(x)C family spore germination C-terminal domain-containing protein [Bianqueaceae bacterium]
MEIEESKCKYGYAMDAEGRLTISLSIEAYAKIGEYAFDRGDDLAEESIRNEIERLASEQIKSDVTTMLAAMQTVYQADICGLNEDMKFQNKKLYLETQDIWQDVFANANFAVDAVVTVRRIGITK